MEKRFRKFLKDNNVNNFFKKKKVEGLTFDYNDPQTLISGRFFWNEQKEGYKFWETLNEKWKKEVNDGKA
jgi:hypothetical protein